MNAQKPFLIGKYNPKTKDFDDTVFIPKNTASYKIDAITVYYKDYVSGIQAQYLLAPSNKTELAGIHVGDATPIATCRKMLFNFDADEYITEIYGRSGEWIDQLGFKTNKCDKGAVGGTGGGPFSIKFPQGFTFEAFIGGVRKYLDALTIYPRPIPNYAFLKQSGPMNLLSTPSYMVPQNQYMFPQNQYPVNFYGQPAPYMAYPGAGFQGAYPGVPFQGVSQGIAAPFQGVAAPTQGVAAPTQGVAAPTQGVSAPFQGNPAGLPVQPGYPVGFQGQSASQPAGQGSPPQGYPVSGQQGYPIQQGYPVQQPVYSGMSQPQPFGFQNQTTYSYPTQPQSEPITDVMKQQQEASKQALKNYPNQYNIPEKAVAQQQVPGNNAPVFQLPGSGPYVPGGNIRNVQGPDNKGAVNEEFMYPSLPQNLQYPQFK